MKISTWLFLLRLRLNFAAGVAPAGRVLERLCSQCARVSLLTLFLSVLLRVRVHIRANLFGVTV